MFLSAKKLLGSLTKAYSQWGKFPMTVIYVLVHFGGDYFFLVT